LWFCKGRSEYYRALDGGKIQSYKELTEKTATLGVSLWNSEMAKRVVFFFLESSPQKSFTKHMV